MSILHMKNIKKHYDGQCVLEIESLTVEKGTICGYLGGNGAGKSTTIKIAMGILTPDEGEVYFQQKKIDYKNPSYKRFIGYCPDYPAIFEKLTVIEHLYFISFLFGQTNENENKKRINKLLQHFELEKYKHVLNKNLSRGNKQKVAIISSVIHEPCLLIYDEPTLGLDPLSLKQFKTFLKDYTQNGGTVFLSSHSLNTIEEIADTVSIINNGKLVKENISVKEIRENLSVEDYLITVLKEEA